MRHLTGLFCMMARLTLEEAKIKSVCMKMKCLFTLTQPLNLAGFL